MKRDTNPLPSMPKQASSRLWGAGAASALSLALALTLAACAVSSPDPAKPAAVGANPAWAYVTPGQPAVPEGATGYTPKPGWQTARWMVAAANPLATDAGYQVLRAGGSAVDAAIAVQMVLTLVEPQSSGIGGGAFLMHWDGQQVAAWDGRETAPAAADENLFMQPDGKPMPFAQAVVGGRSVGVPGVVRMLEAAHREHGRLPWASLFAPAITLAEQGFAVSHRLHSLAQADRALRLDPLARAHFYRADGEAHAIGHVLRNPALAAVFKRLAQSGANALHQGSVAQDIVQRVRTHATNPGRMTLQDLDAYRPVRRAALCTDWQATWRVCGFPPPSSGHLTMMQMLGMLDAQPDARNAALTAVTAVTGGGGHGGQAGQRALSAEWLHYYAEASRLAFADRAHYIADPAFVSAPAGQWTSLLAPDYLRERAALIGERSLGVASPGVPRGATALARQGSMAMQAEGGTSHISIVDAEGRAVAMTTTIEAVFGARLMSDGGTGLPGGFLLNNELTDFSLAPADAQGRPIANRVQPGKRPRSSMSPTLVFDRRDQRLLMSLGSPGGAAIIHFTAKTLLGSLVWGLDAQQAIDLPNVANYNGPTLLEKDRHAPEVAQALSARGHTVQMVELTSGLQAVQRNARGWWGGADPRREGVVMGD